MAGTLGVVLLGWMGKSVRMWNARAVMVNVVAGTISIFIQMKIGGHASLLNKHNVVGRQGTLSTMVALSIVSLLVVRVPVVLLYKMVTQSNSSIAIIQVAIVISQTFTYIFQARPSMTKLLRALPHLLSTLTQPSQT